MIEICLNPDNQMLGGEVFESVDSDVHADSRDSHEMVLRTADKLVKELKERLSGSGGRPAIVPGRRPWKLGEPKKPRNRGRSEAGASHAASTTNRDCDQAEHEEDFVLSSEETFT